MASEINPPYPAFQGQLRSKVVRTAIQEIKDGHNELVNEFNVAVASTASEVTNARDNFTTLQENVRIRRFGDGIGTGGEVSGAGTAVVTYTAGEGVIANGAGVEFSAGTSGSIATATNRWDIISVNSDNSVSISAGTDTATDVLPSISNTKRPLAIIHVTDTSGPTIAQSDIFDARQQGAYFDNKWYFDPQDAIDAVPDATGGHVRVGAGNYYQEIDLSGKNNLTFESDGGANYNRPNDTGYALKSINATGSETTGLKILGGKFKGNSKAGNNELINMAFTDNLVIDGAYLDYNTSATGTYQSALLNSCDGFTANNIVMAQSATATGITNSNNYIYSSNKVMIANNGIDDYISNVVGVAQKTKVVREVLDNFDFTAADTENTVFDLISAYLPNTGDVILVNGMIQIEAGAVQRWMTTFSATRTSATVITFNGMELQYDDGVSELAGALATKTVTDGSGTVMGGIGRIYI